VKLTLKPHEQVFLANENGNCSWLKELVIEDGKLPEWLAHGDAECACGLGFHLYFPRDLAGDLQFGHGGISGDLPVVCPACGTKGFVIVNESLQ